MRTRARESQGFGRPLWGAGRWYLFLRWRSSAHEGIEPQFLNGLSSRDAHTLRHGGLRPMMNSGAHVRVAVSLGSLGAPLPGRPSAPAFGLFRSRRLSPSRPSPAARPASQTDWSCAVLGHRAPDFLGPWRVAPPGTGWAARSRATSWTCGAWYAASIHRGLLCPCPETAPPASGSQTGERCESRCYPAVLQASFSGKRVTLPCPILPFSSFPGLSDGPRSLPVLRALAVWARGVRN